MSNCSRFALCSQPLNLHLFAGKLGLDELSREAKIAHIHDAEWHIWRLRGRKARFRITSFDEIEAMTDDQLNSLYASRFAEISRLFSGGGSPEPQPPSSTPSTDTASEVAALFLPEPPPAPHSVPRASPTHRNKGDEDKVDWSVVGPRIIMPVAQKLFPDRPVSWEKHGEILRFGNSGSLRIFLDGGFQSYDPEEGIGENKGGVLQLVAWAKGITTGEAFQWIKAEGLLNGQFNFDESNHPKRKPKSSVPDDPGAFNFGLKLWKQSKRIPFNARHPARQWANARNLLPPQLPFPCGVRYGVGWRNKEIGQKPYIIALCASPHAFAAAQPENPELAPFKARFHVCWINPDGSGIDKRTYGTFGDSDNCAVVLLGDPNSDQVFVCEGLADALSIYSSRYGAVIASLTTPSVLCKSKTLQYLCHDDRVVHMYPDNDESGLDSGKALVREVVKAGGQYLFYDRADASDPAEAAQRQPFPEVQGFDEAVRVCREREVFEPEREAWLSLGGEVQS